MKERQILFKGDMVRAIMDGRKTQTRRVVKFNKKLSENMMEGEAAEWCPYGRPGDRLWVRETHGFREHPRCRIYYKADMMSYGLDGGWATPNEDSIGICNPQKIGVDIGKPNKWRPSIHMPRWASRINLEVLNVRVERVQDISEQDAKAEGGEKEVDGSLPVDETYQFAFANLWQRINGKPRKDGVDISWYANPWVWVVEFKKIK